MKLAILQSNYIPWKGYFDLINSADKFIFYDEVKYTKNDWRNRNKINTPNGIQWLSIPIGKDAVKQKISEIELNTRWQEKHFRTLFFAYKRAPFFCQLEPILVNYLIDKKWEKLSALNQYLTIYISRLIGCNTVFENSSDYELQGDKVGRLLTLLKINNASKYISGPSAKNYLEDSIPLFGSEGVDVVFMEYDGYPEYRHSAPCFSHHVSIFDMIANLSIEEVKYNIWGWRDRKPFC